MIRLEGHHISPPVVVAEDRAEILALLSQAMGAPLAHAHAVPEALSAHQQLAAGRWPEPGGSAEQVRSQRRQLPPRLTA